MQTVVITGSARGFGLEMLKLFRKENYHVVVCDVAKEHLKNAEAELERIEGKGKILTYLMDVTKEVQIRDCIQQVLSETGSIDMWINNAGVNQPNVSLWELEEPVIDRLLDIDLKGTILCSKLIIPVMMKQKHGQIYNVEGHGSNNAKILGLSLYGTAKRALTYFTEALAYEVKVLEIPIQIGKIAPGIMITNFIHTALGDGSSIELDDKTKKVYNILGDYPSTIAKFMVKKIINNDKNNVKFTWLTNRRATWRFMTSWCKRRNFFK